MSVASETSSESTATELKLLSAVAVRPAILDLLPAFERVTGRKVAASFGLNPAVKMRIEAGELFDVVVITGDMLEDLIRQGKIAFGSRRAFGRVGLGVAVRAGAPKPDLSSVEALKRALVSAKSVAYAGEGSSGAHLTALLARLGILEEVGPRLRSVGGGETGQVVARGEAELGVVPVTTILAATPGAELAGMFPAELQSYIDFAVGLSAATEVIKGGNALMSFLTGPESNELVRSKGVERRK
jgi:molybdate transport system substrate-binding protein